MKETTGPVLTKLKIIRKKGKFIFKSIESDKYPFLFYILQLGVIILTRQDVTITIWLNRHDNDHVLMIMIDVDSQTDK
jgi:hypothetical protein